MSAADVARENRELHTLRAQVADIAAVLDSLEPSEGDDEPEFHNGQRWMLKKVRTRLLGATAQPPCIRAPFTAAQQAALNDFQTDERFHPFTCPNCEPDDYTEPLLVAGKHWTCRTCDYTQYWAHAFMANPAGLGEAS